LGPSTDIKPRTFGVRRSAESEFTDAKTMFVLVGVKVSGLGLSRAVRTVALPALLDSSGIWLGN
jgi:hypothetical protein